MKKTFQAHPKRIGGLYERMGRKCVYEPFTISYSSIALFLLPMPTRPHDPPIGEREWRLGTFLKVKPKKIPLGSLTLVDNIVRDKRKGRIYSRC